MSHPQQQKDTPRSTANKPARSQVDVIAALLLLIPVDPGFERARAQLSDLAERLNYMAVELGWLYMARILKNHIPDDSRCCSTLTALMADEIDYKDVLSGKFKPPYLMTKVFRFAKIVNLTPHDIDVYRSDGSAKITTIPKSTEFSPIRLESDQQQHLGAATNPDMDMSIEIYTPQHFSKPIDWPEKLYQMALDISNNRDEDADSEDDESEYSGEPVERRLGVIVSNFVAQKALEEARQGNLLPFHVLTPGTGKNGAHRDSSGKIIGTKSLESYLDPYIDYRHEDGLLSYLNSPVSSSHSSPSKKRKMEQVSQDAMESD